MTTCNGFQLATLIYTVYCRDPMTSVFRMGPATSERGLCHIDRVLFRVAKSRVKKWKVIVQQKYTDNLGFSILHID